MTPDGGADDDQRDQDDAAEHAKRSEHHAGYSHPAPALELLGIGLGRPGSSFGGGGNGSLG